MIEPPSADPRRSCTLIGHVARIEKDVDETLVTLKCIDERKYEDNVAYFNVVFRSPSRKVFVDREVTADDLLICTCELVSEDKGTKLSLEGNYVIVFRGVIDIWDDVAPAFININDLPDHDNLAF